MGGACGRKVQVCASVAGAAAQRRGEVQHLTLAGDAWWRAPLRLSAAKVPSLLHTTCKGRGSSVL